MNANFEQLSYITTEHTVVYSTYSMNLLQSFAENRICHSRGSEKTSCTCLEVWSWAQNADWVILARQIAVEGQ